MAAVKAQRGGPRKEPVFKPSLCASCSGALDTLKQAWRVKSIYFVGTKRHSSYDWHHRTCVK
jgi:hypothetical protein